MTETGGIAEAQFQRISDLTVQVSDLTAQASDLTAERDYYQTGCAELEQERNAIKRERDALEDDSVAVELAEAHHDTRQAQRQRDGWRDLYLEVVADRNESERRLTAERDNLAQCLREEIDAVQAAGESVAVELAEAQLLRESFDRVTTLRDLRTEIRDALQGDSNDAEHDALASIAEWLGIDYDTD